MIFPSILIKIKHIKRLTSKKKPFKHSSSNAKMKILYMLLIDARLIIVKKIEK